MLPAAVLDAADPEPEDAVTELVRRAARSHGVATPRCLADYYRMRLQPAPGRPSAKVAIDELVEAGELLPVRSRAGSGRRTSTATPGCRAGSAPGRCSARSTRWSGSATRTEALFDFHYRIEIYVPAAQRVHGYYVLPFLLGDRIVGRVDLKADRASRRAARARRRTPSRARRPRPPRSWRAELRRLAGWLGLDDIVVEPRGDLAPGAGSRWPVRPRLAGRG